MDRRNFLALLAALPFSSRVLLAADAHPYDQDDQGHGHGNGNGHGKGKSKNHGNNVYFRQQDYGVVENYYQGPRNLPPGLAKKYYRTGTLPPGWEKKLQPFPPTLVQQLPPPPPNCAMGYIDGQAVVYDRTTRVIVDSIDLIGALSGH
jgi:hypothetical protein